MSHCIDVRTGRDGYRLYPWHQVGFVEVVADRHGVEGYRVHDLEGRQVGHVLLREDLEPVVVVPNTIGARGVEVYYSPEERLVYVSDEEIVAWRVRSTTADPVFLQAPGADDLVIIDFGPGAPTRYLAREITATSSFARAVRQVGAYHKRVQLNLRLDEPHELLPEELEEARKDPRWDE